MPVSTGDVPFGLEFRDPRETLRDALLWMHEAVWLPARRIGTLRSSVAST
jgi:hypothetical protein